MLKFIFNLFLIYFYSHFCNKLCHSHTWDIYMCQENITLFLLLTQPQPSESRLRTVYRSHAVSIYSSLENSVSTLRVLAPRLLVNRFNAFNRFALLFFFCQPQNRLLMQSVAEHQSFRFPSLFSLIFSQQIHIPYTVANQNNTNRLETQ